jgi:hypothetical protein
MSVDDLLQTRRAEHETLLQQEKQISASRLPGSLAP